MIKVISLLQMAGFQLTHLTLENMPYKEIIPLLPFLERQTALQSLHVNWSSDMRTNESYGQKLAVRDIKDLLVFMGSATTLSSVLILNLSRFESCDKIDGRHLLRGMEAYNFSEEAKDAFSVALVKLTGIPLRNTVESSKFKAAIQSGNVLAVSTLIQQRDANGNLKIDINFLGEGGETRGQRNNAILFTLDCCKAFTIAESGVIEKPHGSQVRFTPNPEILALLQADRSTWFPPQQRTQSSLVAAPRYFGVSFFHAAASYQQLDAVNMALDHRPDSVYERMKRAEIFISVSRYDDALYDCNYVLNKFPQQVDALIIRASVYEKQSRIDDALRDYRYALEIEPHNEKALESIARLSSQNQPK